MIMQSALIKAKLQNMVGSEFENSAQFILHLLYPQYIGTRKYKDDGIDGFRKSKKVRTNTLLPSAHLKIAQSGRTG
ncbi:hypothetical protein B5G50_21475 [Brevibacillus brevis]|nr:hypothetical protein B5G50_21475 [Brevibacillus brevis]